MESKTPEYLNAVVQKKPHRDDPKEIAIAEKIRDQALREKWAQKTFAEIKNLQIEYLREMTEIKGPSPYVYNRTQEIVGKISNLLKAQIMEGSEHLSEIPKGSPVLIMTNHLGLYKLIGINPKTELGTDIPGYDFMYPSPMYFAGLNPVTKAIGDNLSYVSDDFPGVFGEIHRNSGFVHVPPVTIQSGSRTEILLEQTKNVFTKYPKTGMVNFPEGGTSGKYSGLGPYDLDAFKTGGYVIASKLGIHVIPVAQYFDPQKGLQLKVFQPYIPEITNKEGYEKHAKKDQEGMQEWFNQRKAF